MAFDELHFFLVRIRVRGGRVRVSSLVFVERNLGGRKLNILVI